ncbi:hypothetical protein MZK49_05610 [Ensifer sesbaniae]|uniref:hypothetical protein n=1 Tax=Ensifer sesbaniae TaxID=1214071 RepID=UPI002000A2B2|nr:hypothetical protein [Ensifer sesbaniae]
MKIQFNIPQNGYKADIKQAIESGTYDQWVDGKFGARIRELIGDDFSMVIAADSFVVDFVNDDDGRTFLATFGGRTIE